MPWTPKWVARYAKNRAFLQAHANHWVETMHATDRKVAYIATVHYRDGTVQTCVVINADPHEGVLSGAYLKKLYQAQRAYVSASEELDMGKEDHRRTLRQAERYLQTYLATKSERPYIAQMEFVKSGEQDTWLLINENGETDTYLLTLLHEGKARVLHVEQFDTNQQAHMQVYRRWYRVWHKQRGTQGAIRPPVIPLTFMQMLLREKVNRTILPAAPVETSPSAGVEHPPLAPPKGIDTQALEPTGDPLAVWDDGPRRRMVFHVMRHRDGRISPLPQGAHHTRVEQVPDPTHIMPAEAINAILAEVPEIHPDELVTLFGQRAPARKTDTWNPKQS